MDLKQHDTAQQYAAMPQHHAATHDEKLIITASSLGTVFEWYDFYLYGSLAAIIAKQFFSGVNETAGFIFALSFVFVFLFLAALYESFTLPVAVFLIVPIGMWAASAAQHSQSLEAWFAHLPGLVVVEWLG